MWKMMWLASLLIFISIGGSFCDDDDDERDCFVQKREKCEDEYELHAEFPQTGEELLTVCRNLETLGTCMVEARESCYGGGPNLVTDDIRNAVDYLKETCQEDNPTFKAIANNLPCVERVIKSRPGGGFSHCSAYFSEENLETIHTHMQPFMSDESKEDLANCLSDLMDVTCEGVAFGYHCGEEVMDAVQEIMARMRSPHSLECTAEQLEELSPFMGIFEGLLVEELALQNALERKRK